MWWALNGTTREQTVRQLADLPFNKLRFSLMPMNFRYTREQPWAFLFQIKSGEFVLNSTDWDFTRYNLEFWQVTIRADC